MGKIPKYSRQKFQSTYVGGLQTDKSGSIIAGGMAQAVAPLIEQGVKKEEARLQTIVDQQADSALLQYSLTYQKKAKELQKEYANNTAAYPEAVAKMGVALQEDYGAKIPDERVRARFSGGASAVVRAGMGPSMAWQEAKDEENAYIAWQDNLDTAVEVTSTQTTIPDFTASLGEIASIAESNALTTPKVRLSAREIKTEEAVRAFMSAQLEADARVFWRDIDSGKYTDLKYEHKDKTFNVPLSPKTKAEYKALAKSRTLTQQAEKQIEDGLRVTGELQELALKVDKGEAGIRDLLYKRDQIYAKGTADEQPPSTKEEKANIDALIRLEVSTLAKSGKQDPSTLDDLNSKWLKLSDDIRENVDNPENLTTELLKYNTDVINAFATGKITQTDYTSMNRKLSLPLMQSIRKQTGQKGFLGLGGYSDPLGAQYKKLVSAVSSMSLNDSQKVNTRTKAFSFFLDAVSIAEDKGITSTPEGYDAMATSALRKAQNIYFENVGEPTDTVITIKGMTYHYVGLNANGVADYQPSGSVQSAAKMKR